MVTKICVGNYVQDTYHHEKFYLNRFRGFSSAHAWFRAPKVTRLLFGGEFLRKATAETRAPILTQNTSNDAVPRKEVPFGGRKNKISGFDPYFPPKPPFLGPISTGLRIFSSENGFNIGRLESKRPLIVVEANKSCIVNRQIGVADSKYVIVFDPPFSGHVIQRMRSGRVRIFNANQWETL